MNSSAKHGLARSLSKLGYCSRAQAWTLIQAGRVRLNGRICRDPEAGVRLERDRIEVDEKPVVAQRIVYVMLNKPRGLVTSRSDEHGRATIYDCLPHEGFPWLAPVGRLDKASEGLLLLTNDTQWAQRLLDPETHVDKRYHVQIDRRVESDLCARLAAGLHAPDGEFLSAKRVSLLREGVRNSWLEIILDEGKNRHIRRLLEACQLQVLRLVRIAIGPLELGTLPKGQFRHLTAAEVAAVIGQ